MIHVPWAVSTFWMRDISTDSNLNRLSLRHYPSLVGPFRYPRTSGYPRNRASPRGQSCGYAPASLAWSNFFVLGWAFGIILAWWVHFGILAPVDSQEIVLPLAYLEAKLVVMHQQIWYGAISFCVLEIFGCFLDPPKQVSIRCTSSRWRLGATLTSESRVFIAFVGCESCIKMER